MLVVSAYYYNWLKSDHTVITGNEEVDIYKILYFLANVVKFYSSAGSHT